MGVVFWSAVQFGCWFTACSRGRIGMSISSVLHAPKNMSHGLAHYCANIGIQLV